MQVSPDTDSQSIEVLDSPSQYCLALLTSVAVRTQATSCPVPELLSSSPHVYHFVIPDSESQRSRLAVVQQRRNKSLLSLPFLQVFYPLITA